MALQGGLGIITAAIFLSGEMAGSGVLALPASFVGTGGEAWGGLGGGFSHTTDPRVGISAGLASSPSYNLLTILVEDFWAGTSFTSLEI